MAQTGFTPISLYYTTTASAAPTAANLVAGELAINTNDGVLYYKDSSGVVQSIASKAGNSGSFTNISVSGVASFADGTVSLPSITNIGDTNTGIFFPTADTIAFTEGGAESMRIDSSGNVGIGTSSPNRKLEVAGASGADTAMIRSSASADTTFYREFGRNNSSGAFEIRRAQGGAATTDFVIDTSGNVGIGTSTPSSKLTVLGSSATLGQLVSSGSACYLEMDNSGGSTYIGSTNNDMQFLTGAVGTERMRIDSSGNLLVGTTTGGDRVQSYGNFGTTGSGYAYGSRSTSASGASAFFHQFVVAAGGSPAEVGTIAYNGTLTVYATTSDQRMKENIVDAPSAINYLNSVKIRSFDWISTKNNVTYGVIAQELESVCPSAISKGIKENDMWAVDTSVLVPAMIKAIQELNAEVQSLKQQLGK
jgi:hypothetical protein